MESLLSVIMMAGLLYVTSFGIRGIVLRARGEDESGKMLFRKGFKLFLIYIIASIVITILFYNIK